MRQTAVVDPVPSLPPTDRLLSLKDVCERVALSRASVWRMYTEDEFPKPARIGARSLWSEREVSAWIAERLEAR
ncbi:MAG: AlpA family phage regulatory protein [Gemmatimonadaceae bacterium]|nr:AlpA family phage regulatory protein [Gemmatimonadaceae bacterium]